MHIWEMIEREETKCLSIKNGNIVHRSKGGKQNEVEDGKLTFWDAALNTAYKGIPWLSSG